MPGILDRLNEEERLRNNAQLSQAERQRNWSETFASTPPTEVLRDRVNYDAALERARRRTLELASQSDRQALRLLRDTAEYEESQKLAPLREELLRRRIESTGAAQRFAEQKDAEAMGDVAGFMTESAALKDKVGTPEFASSMGALVSKYPRVVGTQVGQDALRKMQREHQDVSALKPPEGQELEYIDFDEDGRVKARFRPIPPKADTKIPKGMVPSSATVNKRGDVSVQYAQPKVDKPKPDKPDSYDKFNKDLEAAKKAYENAKGTDFVNGLPPFIQAAFEQRGKKLEEAAKAGGNVPPTPPPTNSVASGSEEPTGPAKIATASDFAALPSGAEFIDPQGVRRRKP